MKVIALLCWYDEQPSHLAATVASLGRCADHLIALDGAYMLYPGASLRPSSDQEQIDTITRVARATGIGVTLETRNEPWYGNEIEKRSHLFALGGLIAEPDDWFLVIDADEVIFRTTGDFRDQLANCAVDVASVQLTTPVVEVGEMGQRVEMRTSSQQQRRLYRALPNIKVEGAHYVYTADKNGERVLLWGNEAIHDLEPCAEFGNYIELEHRQMFRSLARQNDKREYYGLRDSSGAERLHTYTVRKTH